MAKPATAQERKDRQVKRGVFKAALSPLNVSVMALASAGAAAVGSLGVLAAGGVAYVAMVAWDLSSKSFWKKVAAPPLQKDGLPAVEDLFDSETKQAVTRIAAARAKIARVMGETPESVTTHVGPVVESLTELDGRAGRLAVRSDQIARHLHATSIEELREEIAGLAAKAAGARDPDARRQYLEAQTARQGQMKSLEELTGAHDRVLASLARILTTLEGIPTQIVKMGALDAQAVDDFSGDVGEQLDRINVEMRAFEETLETLVEERET
jgi:hypothetical protein